MTNPTPKQSTERPVRIQRKRSKGWKMPPNTVYVGRPTKWGNLWRAGNGVPSQRVVDLFRKLIAARDESDYGSSALPKDIRSEDIKRELSGKNLACWCPLDQPCHADVLLEIANAERCEEAHDGMA